MSAQNPTEQPAPGEHQAADPQLADAAKDKATDLTPEQMQALIAERAKDLEKLAQAAPQETKLKINADGYIEQTVLPPKVKVADVEFQPAETFQGSRPGFVFKNGDRGVGYYSDEQGKLNKALQKMEAKFMPEVAMAKKAADMTVLATQTTKPRENPTLETDGDEFEVEFTQAKWGITARMVGGPVVLTKIKEGGEGKSLGLEIGDEMIVVHGVDVRADRPNGLRLLRQGGPAKVKFFRAKESAAVVPANVAEVGEAKATAIAGSKMPQGVKELQAMIGSAKAKDTVTVAGQKGLTKTLEDGSFDPNSTLVFFNCEDCEYTVESYCLKVYVQGCKNCTIHFNSKILTATMEVYKSSQLTLNINTKVGTLQCDMTDGIRAKWATRNEFIMVVWAGCEKLSVGFDDDPASLESGFAEMSEVHSGLSRERSQFKISSVDGKIIQEAVIRLPNGFATTEREKAIFDANQELAVKAMAKEMGITIRPAKKDKKKKKGKKGK